MSRTIRSEFAANELQALPVIAAQARRMAIKSTREDWRRVLARRDAKRAAVRNTRPVRTESGHVLADVLFAVCLGLAGASFLFVTLSA